MNISCTTTANLAGASHIENFVCSKNERSQAIVYSPAYIAPISGLHFRIPWFIPDTNNKHEINTHLLSLRNGITVSNNNLYVGFGFQKQMQFSSCDMTET